MNPLPVAIAQFIHGMISAVHIITHDRRGKEARSLMRQYGFELNGDVWRSDVCSNHQGARGLALVVATDLRVELPTKDQLPALFLHVESILKEKYV